MTDPRREDPVLITDAQMSYEEELEVRKRRYKWTMGLRFPCIILAGLFYQIPWLAVTLLVISVPLPWIAVLIANDRLPRTTEKPNRYRHGEQEIEARVFSVIDSAEEDTGAGPGTAGGTDTAGCTGTAGTAGSAGTAGPAGTAGSARTADPAGAADTADTAGAADTAGGVDRAATARTAGQRDTPGPG